MYAVKIERAWIEVLPDPHADTSYLEQDGFEDRREAYERGDFTYAGVRACAQLRYETEQRGWINGPIVSSAGLWGIEDDSGEDYLREIGEEEAAELVPMLEALGISHRRALSAKRNALASPVVFS